MNFKTPKDTEKFLSGLGYAINETLAATLDQNVGFALLLFDFHNPGIGNYISNAKREDMIKALRETADRLERGEDIPPAKGSIQ